MSGMPSCDESSPASPQADLGSRVRRSIVALQGRQALILAMNLGIGVILARKLDPEIFGLYGIATFCLSLVTKAIDLGIGGSLVQRKGELGEREISVVFTMQGALAIVAAIAIWFSAPLSLHVYRKAPDELVWIIRSLILPTILSPLATSARLQMEREIQFQRLATIDITAMVVGNAVLLAGVFSGAQVWSFVWGNIANSVVTAFLSVALVRIRPRPAFDRRICRELLSFGLFFQFGNLANEAAGWIIPLIAGASLGPAAVGLLAWASSNARRPLMLVDNVMRVAFPHFSRLQDQPLELAQQVGHYFRRLLLISAAWSFLAFPLGAPMTHLVYSDKWLPGVVSLQLFGLGLLFDVLNWVGGMTLTAIGGVKETAVWTLVKSVIAIGGAFLAIRIFGIEGIPLASLVASLVAGAGILARLRRKIPLDLSHIANPIWPFLIAGAAFLPFHLAGGTIRTTAAWVSGLAAIAWTAAQVRKEFFPTKRPSIPSTT